MCSVAGLSVNIMIILEFPLKSGCNSLFSLVSFKGKGCVSVKAWIIEVTSDEF